MQRGLLGNPWHETSADDGVTSVRSHPGAHLAFSWAPFVDDPPSTWGGMLRYAFAVGTAPGAADVYPWTPAGLGVGSATTAAAAVRKVVQFWKSLGACTVRLDAARHDLIVGRTSHLPHVAAAALAGLILDPKHPKSQVGLCATGFRDTTRIASGSPEMWRDIALANRKNVSQSVDAFVAELKKLQTALKKGDAKAVEKFFATAKERRDNWCAGSALNSSE